MFTKVVKVSLDQPAGVGFSYGAKGDEDYDEVKLNSITLAPRSM
jgi:hypothetical protein